MPYIKPEDRIQYDKLIDDLVDILRKAGSVSGHFNYVISSIITRSTKKVGISYFYCNNIIGMLECVKQEFYRRIVAPYEDKKIQENGDII